MSWQWFITLTVLNGIVLGITTQQGSWQWIVLVVWTAGLVTAAVTHRRNAA